MDIFNYFDEECADIEKKLKAVTENYHTWSREKVFDQVKLICDSIMGHLKKQENLLLANIDKTTALQESLDACQRDRARVEEEIGQLVMVHVDEPAYDEYLANLLKAIEQHIEFSRGFYKRLREIVPSNQLETVNTQLADMVLHTAEYNAIQTSGGANQ